MIKIVLGILLFFYGILDIKDRKIGVRYLLLGIVFLCTCRIFLSPVSFRAFCTGCIPGMVMLLFSRITKGKIGEADGCILLISGIGCGFFDNLMLLFYAACLAAVVSLLLLALRKVNTKTEIPFIPFLFLGYLGVVI